MGIKVSDVHEIEGEDLLEIFKRTTCYGPPAPLIVSSKMKTHLDALSLEFTAEVLDGIDECEQREREMLEQATEGVERPPAYDVPEKEQKKWKRWWSAAKFLFGKLRKETR